MAKYTAQDRRDLAKKGHALPDGSFPIADVEDLKSAIRNWGLGSQPNVAKRHIIERAKAMGQVSVLPDKWNVTESVAHGEDFATDFLEHFGVKGMKWGRRKADTSESSGSSSKQKKPDKTLFKIPGTRVNVQVRGDALGRIAKAEAVLGVSAGAAYVGFRAAQKINTNILIKNTERLVSDAATRKAAGRILQNAQKLPYAKIVKGVYQATTVK